MRHIRLFPFPYSLFTLLVLLAAPAAHATTYTWDVVPGTVGVGNGTITGGTGTWNTTNGNWTTDGGANNVAWPTSGTDNDAVFGGTVGTVTISGVTVNDIAVNDNDGYILSGINLLAFNGTTPTITLNKAATLSAPALGGFLLFGSRLAGSGALTVGSTNNQRWILNTGTGSNSGFTGDIIINGAGVNTIFEPRDTLTSLTGNSVTLTTSGFLQIVFADASINALNGTAGTVRSNSFDVGPSRTLTVGKDGGTGSFSGTMQDNGLALKLTKTGSGTQELSGTAITYTGGTTLNGGTLKLTDTTAFNSNVTMTNGTLQLNGTTGTWILSKTLNTGAASVLKTGAGTVELTGGGSYTGGTTISAGTLYANAVAPGTGLVTLGDANTGTDNVQFDVRNTGLANAITVANQGTGTATIRYVNVAGGWTQSGGTVTLNRAATMSVPNTTGTIVYNPVLAGSGALTMGTINGQRFVLQGSSPTYTGDVTVESGTVFEPRNVLTSATGNSFTVNGTGILQIAFADSSIGGLNGGGTVRRIDLGGDGGTRTLTIGKGDAPGSFSGTITQASGVLALTKIGGGTQTLVSTPGANTYTGLTTISAGTLLYGNNDQIATGDVTVNGATAILDLATFTDSLGTVTLDGGGTITATSGVLTSTANFEMKSGTANASLAGNVHMSKTTAGTVILSGAGNTFIGNTTVSAGELHLDKSSGNAVNDSAFTPLLSIVTGGVVKLLASNQMGDEGGVVIGAGSSLNMQSFTDTIYQLDSASGGTVTGTSGSLLTVGTGTPGSGSGNVDGVIAGAVNLTKAGSGTTLNLNNVSNTHTGNTTVSAGTLALVNAGTTNNIANSPVIRVDATLDVTSLSASTLALTAGQTLQGSGTVLGNVTAATSGSTISPGNSIESLLITGDITFGAGGTFDYEIDSGAALAVGADLLYGDGGAGGALNISGSPTLSLTNLGAGSVAAGTKFTLIAYDSGDWNGGIFAGRPDDSLIYGFAGINWWLNYNDTSAGSNFTTDAGSPNTAWLTITATTVPEPSTYALGLIGLVGLGLIAWRRERGGRK